MLSDDVALAETLREKEEETAEGRQDKQVKDVPAAEGANLVNPAPLAGPDAPAQVVSDSLVRSAAPGVPTVTTTVNSQSQWPPTASSTVATVTTQAEIVLPVTANSGGHFFF